jgi:hypothetical protein
MRSERTSWCCLEQSTSRLWLDQQHDLSMCSPTPAVPGRVSGSRRLREGRGIRPENPGPGIPLIVLADTPGYLPGRGQESRLRSSTVFGLVENFTVLMVFATSVAYFLRRTVYVAIPSRPSQDQDYQHLDSARSSAA